MREWLTRAALPLLRGGDFVLDRALTATADASRTVKFLQGRARFVERDDDVFVSSYPRSGTTWTLALVHLLVSGEDDFTFAHLSDVTPWWERSLAWRSEAAEELERLPGPRVFKTHLPRRWLPSRGRYLYAVRNPEDVAVSYFHLYRRYLRFSGTFDEFFERFLEGDLQYRSWFRHVAGWEADRDHPRVLLVPYDEMRKDTATWVRTIATFLGIPIDEARARRIAELTDFQRMKAAEDKFDHEGELLRQWGVREGAFIREGKVNRGGAELTAAHRARLEELRQAPVFLPAVEWRLPSFLR